MEKETVSNNYNITGAVVCVSDSDLETNRDAFILRTKPGIKQMTIDNDSITNVYIK